MKEATGRKAISDDTYTNGTTNTNSVDIAFRKINKNCTGFQIWRVENMNIVSVPKDQFGVFYDVDSYVIYSSSVHEQPPGVDMTQREIRGTRLEYHIHFWLGSCTTPDKSGVAAYKTVELDNFLNGSTVQHRETQGNESNRFKSYFRNGLKVLKFSLKENAVPNLYKIRGKRTSVVTQMDKVVWDYFNSRDIFLLHTPKVLFVWTGRSANAAEKLHASKISMDMKEQLNLSNIIFVDDGYEKTLQDDERKEFNKYLPLDKRHVLPETENDLNSQQHNVPIKLYKCSENSGKYRVSEIKVGPFNQNDLEADDVFIIDQETKGIWIWVGKRASDKEKSEALRNARGFVKKKKYPNNTKVTRVVDGFEPVEFKLLFSTWKHETIKPGKPNKPTVLVSKFDAVTMEERPNLSAETQLIDDGTGTVTLWRVKQNSINEIPKERHGFFFSSDCYIVLYTYQASNNEQKHLLYYWLGSQASQEEITCATIKISEIDEELGGLGFQARVIQGQEPAHFLQLFKGKLIVFKGKGTDYDESGRNLKNPSQYFLQISGSTVSTSKALQIQPRAAMLNSNSCFVLKRGKVAFIWCGNYSTGDQREMAKGFAGKHFEMILEGKEKQEFFELLGGKTTYCTQLKKIESDTRPPRLFYCTRNACGNLIVDEILFFTQNDLVPEDVLLLDFYITVYVWVGNLSSKDDQRQSMTTALEYLQMDPSGRDMNVTIIHINQGCEPPTFTGFFPTWNSKLWKGYKSFGKLRQEIERNNISGDSKEKNGYTYQKSGHSNDFDQFDKYPVNILKEANDKLPARVDPLNKELHLTHDDFVSILKITYLEFEKLPKWKQQEMKKKVGLF